MIGEKRSSLEILQEILVCAQEGHKKTRIMYGANLSYDMLTRYLDFLLAKRFLVAEERTGKFNITPEGLQFKSDLEQVIRHIRDPDVAVALPL